MTDEARALLLVAVAKRIVADHALADALRAQRAYNAAADGSVTMAVWHGQYERAVERARSEQEHPS